MVLFPTNQIDAHRVAPKLWIGSYPSTEKATEIFDVVVLCAWELQEYPPLRRHQSVMRVPMHDLLQMPSQSAITRAMGAIGQIQSLRMQGKRVLVSCVEGVNRSSFLAALVLMHEGQTAHEATTLVRRQRKPRSGKTPLCNLHFVRALHELEPKIRSQLQKAI